MPVVSPNAIRSAPSPSTRSTMDATRVGGTSPSYGQPKLVDTITSTVAPAAWTSPMRRPMSASDSSVDRLTLWRLWVSEAETTTSSSRKPAARARWAPRELGTRAEYRTSGAFRAAAHTSSASAICGIALGCTKLTASMRRTPVAESASSRRTLASVGTGSSFCRPSRGPTSRIETAEGSSSIPPSSLHRTLHAPIEPRSWC